MHSGVRSIGVRAYQRLRIIAGLARHAPECIVRPVPRAPDSLLTPNIKQGLGVAVFAHDRPANVSIVLESLVRQDAADCVHVWIDGDQGNREKKKRVDETEFVVSRYPVKEVIRNRGNFGFRKMMLIAARQMAMRYSKLVFLEDDCFPSRDAIKTFAEELDRISRDPSVFSIYGHPFYVIGEEKKFYRFQGWGWGTTSEKLLPVWNELEKLYLMDEKTYLAHVNSLLTSEVKDRIDVTPGRQPTETLRKFFAWDESVCLITAIHGLSHEKTPNRIIYNFGIGDTSTHFDDVRKYRLPPFNLISRDEVWAYY